jgi:acyl-coenzyme A synthetase/AMP-(fatty) acid ligase
MKPRLISTLLLEARDDVVSFDRLGQELRWPALVGRVAALRAQLDRHPGTRWAVIAPDTFDFACALLAAWLAGKTPVLVPNAQSMRAWRDALQLDGVIGNAPLDGLPRVAADRGTETAAAELRIPPASELFMFTSGSTGPPRQVRKELRHLQAELEVLESMWGHDLGGRRSYASVSHQHMYGLLFRLLWPLTTGRPFASFDLEFPEHLVGGFEPGSVLVASPALLKRLGGLDGQAGHPWHRVFSSGGLLPEQAARDSERLLGTTPVEVLGSTESGGVAWRQRSGRRDAERWRTLDEVRIRADQDGFLCVSSPFTGHSGWFRMGDLVRIRRDRSFELLGRGDRIAKIEDKRVSLAEIEQWLSTHEYVADCAAVAVDDDARQAIGLVIVLTQSGRMQLAEQGRQRLARALRKALRERFEAVVMPRRFRYVETIPVNPQGKREHHALVRLLRARP